MRKTAAQKSKARKGAAGGPAATSRRPGKSPAARKASPRSGKPVAPASWAWHEVLTHDPASARRFYEGLLGWKARDASVTEQPYAVFSDGQGDVAGLMAIPHAHGQPVCAPQWLSYVRVPNVDESVARALVLGGAVEAPPMDIPGIGRFAVLKDPGGASFAVYAAKS